MTTQENEQLKHASRLANAVHDARRSRVRLRRRHWLRPVVERHLERHHSTEEHTGR